MEEVETMTTLKEQQPETQFLSERTTPSEESQELKVDVARPFFASQAQRVRPVFDLQQQDQIDKLETIESGTSKITTSSLSIDSVSSLTSSGQQIQGTPNGEIIEGTPGNDIIASLGGDDTVYGRDGNDAISGGSGNDLVEGNGGSDIIYGDYSPSANADLQASGNDTLSGGGGRDFLYGQDRNDIISGGSGDDYIEGGKSDDVIYGQGGNDILYGDDFENNSGVSGNDVIDGGDGSDSIYGGRGVDILRGNTGSDLIVAGQGNDALDGGNGNDQLIGTDTAFFGQVQQGFGFGEIDSLIGGRDNDTFVLGLAQANARDASGNDVTVNDVVLYNDGNNVNSSGILDYGLIKDFGFNNDGFNRGIDKIQLAGEQSWYSLGESPLSSISGTGIFFIQNQSTPELIGIVEGISQASLSLSDTNQFIFV
jgi:Ca2+-binding RTX toxin-like protein